MLYTLFKRGGKYLIDGRNTGLAPNVSYVGELNQTLLNGAQPIYYEDAFAVDAPVSDANGAVAVTAQIDIKAWTKIDGFTIIFDVFGGVYPKNITVRLKLKNDETNVYETVGEKILTLTSPTAYVDLSYGRVDRIEISATSIQAPYARFKISNIYSGKLLVYTDYDMISCDVIEQVDPVSSTLPYGVCDITLRSSEKISYDENKPWEIELYHNNKFYGLYFVDSITYLGDKKYKISAHDIIGELDKYMFVGDVYTSTPAKTLISKIHDAAKLKGVDFSSFPDDSTKEIRGHIPRGTCREALQMVLQAAGWYATAARSYTINYNALKTGNETSYTEISTGYSISESETADLISIQAHEFISAANQSSATREFERFTADEYGTGYKPVIFYPEKPVDVSYVAMHQNELLRNVSNANEIHVDGTLTHLETNNSGDQYSTNKWYIDLYLFVDQALTKEKGTQSGLNREEIADNTMIYTSYVNSLLDLNYNWYSKPNAFYGNVLGEMNCGDAVKLLIKNSSFSGVVTQLSYPLTGKIILYGVTCRGTYNR